MRAPRMRVGVYGDSRTSSLPDLLSQVGHDVSYMDYDPTPPAFEELDMVVLEVRDPLLEPAIERLAERARRGQIFIHTSLQHGVQVMDPLEVTGAVVTMWVIVAVLALVSWLATRKLRDVPGPLQNAAEMAVEKLQGFYRGNGISFAGK